MNHLAKEKIEMGLQREIVTEGKKELLKIKETLKYYFKHEKELGEERLKR